MGTRVPLMPTPGARQILLIIFRKMPDPVCGGGRDYLLLLFSFRKHAGPIVRAGPDDEF